MREDSVNTKKPNVILVLCDDLGYGDIGCFGSTRSKTPTLDQMAREGAKLTDFHVASPVCSPSRAGILTGCYPQRVGLGRGENFCVLLPGDRIGINPDEIIIPKIMKQSGYVTKMIGKWHLGDQPPFLPANNGFDSFFGLPYSNDMCYYHPDLKVTFPPLPLMRQNEIVGKDPRQGPLNEEYIAEATSFIETHHTHPFFLYLAHMYVHWPFYPPTSFLAKADNDKYRAEIEFIDWGMAQIFATLEKHGIKDNTLVIFTSDNGGVLRYGSNGPLRGQKGDIYEGGMRVPCLVRWPLEVRGGRIIDSLTTSMDFLPTLASIVGVKLDANHIVDGLDISAGLRNQQKFPKDRILCYYHENILRAIRKGDWKYIIQTNELFYLPNDIGEQKNLSQGNEAKIRELMELVEKYRAELGDGERIGEGVRPCGRVASPKKLFEVDESVYYTAEYE